MVEGPRLRKRDPRLMAKFFESIRQLKSASKTIRKRPQGIIEVRRGQWVSIHFCPWPMVISSVEARWMGRWRHQRVQRDQYLLF